MFFWTSYRFVNVFIETEQQGSVINGFNTTIVDKSAVQIKIDQIWT